MTFNILWLKSFCDVICTSNRKLFGHVFLFVLTVLSIMFTLKITIITADTRMVEFVEKFSNVHFLQTLKSLLEFLTKQPYNGASTVEISVVLNSRKLDGDKLSGTRNLVGMYREDTVPRAVLLKVKVSQHPDHRFKKLNWKIYKHSVFLFTNPFARAGYDTRSIFKRSLTGLN